VPIAAIAAAAATTSASSDGQDAAGTDAGALGVSAEVATKTIALDNLKDDEGVQNDDYRVGD